MILVSHYVAPSAISGLGLFTAVDIAAGEEVYRYDPLFVKIFAESDIGDLPESMQAFMRKYAYRGAGEHRLRGAVYFCMDDSRFINHADAPNLHWDHQKHCYRAKQAIPAHTELTGDYADFTESGDFYTAYR